jgi:site-specific DNA recombinase
MKTAAIYARVSTEEQVKNTSLRGQVEACREYAQKQGYTIIREVTEDFSGARLDRPGLDELRGMADRGEIEALVVFEADRLSRKVGHLLLLEEELSRRGVGLLFVNGQDDTTSPEGRMFFTMRGAFGEFERTKIIERTRLGKLRMARQGKAIGNNFQPLGYAIHDGHYHIIEDEARIVRFIFEWAVYDRLSIRGIGLRLTQMGATTKRGNTHWAPPSIKNILDNPVYTGTAYWNRNMATVPKKRRTDEPRKIEKSSHKQRDMSEWIAIPCPQIVSQSLWDAAQRQLQLNKERSPRRTKRNYLLRGLIKCGHCGYGYYGRDSRGFAYYYCGGGEIMTDPLRPNYTGHKCQGRPMRADGPKGIEERIWKYIRNRITDEEALLATFEQRGIVQAEEVRRDQDELETLYAAEGKLKTEQNKMLDLYSQDIITLDQLQERLAMLRKKQQDIDEEKSKVTAHLDRQRDSSATTEALGAYCKRVREGMALAEAAGNDIRREWLEMLGTIVTVGEEIEIEGIIDGRMPLIEPQPGTDCSLCSDHVLFRSEEHIARWCDMWGRPRGGTLSLEQGWKLANAWYGDDRRDPSWRRRTPQEATAIFESIGMTGPFWQLTP